MSWLGRVGPKPACAECQRSHATSWRLVGRASGKIFQLTLANLRVKCAELISSGMTTKNCLLIGHAPKCFHAVYNKFSDTFEMQTCLNTCAYTRKAVLSWKKNSSVFYMEASIFSAQSCWRVSWNINDPSSLLIFPFPVLLVPVSESVGVLLCRFVNMWRCEMSFCWPLKKCCKYAWAHHKKNMDRAGEICFVLFVRLQVPVL